MWLYGFAKAVVSPLFRLGFRIRVEGVENIPREGGVILFGNHIHYLDPVIVGIAVPRPVSFMAKEEAFRGLLGFLIRGLGAFPVKRGTADRTSLKRALEILAEGGCFGIFPEGTRSRTGELQKPEPGTAYIGLKAKVPMVPFGITAQYKLFRPVLIRFGPPVNLEEFAGAKLNGATLEAASQVLVDCIRQLVEPPTDAAKA